MAKKFNKYIKKAVELGAEDAKIVDAASVVTAAWVRMKCRFGCGGYGSNHCCPPESPGPEETRNVLDCYKTALLIHCRGVANVKSIALELEKEIFLDGYYKALGFGAGPCELCRKCNPDYCVKPYEARPAMEACGMDVFATARANGYEIEVLRDGSCEGNYFGLVLIE